MNYEDPDIEDVIDTIDENIYGQMLIYACQLLSGAGTNRGEHYSPSRILMDILEAQTFANVAEEMERDYEKK